MEELEMLKGVMVKDLQNGIRFAVVGIENDILKNYDIRLDLSKYDELELFDICSNVSSKISNLYYENIGLPSQEQVEELLRAELVR